MRNKEDILRQLADLQSISDRELQFDEEAILVAYQKSNGQQSLVIKILSVFGGILASLAFLGFLFIAGLYNSDIGLVIFGLLFLAGAMLINSAFDKIIIDTLSISSFLMGLILLAVGLDKLSVSLNIVSLLFILIALLSLSIVQNYILSFVAVLVINGSMLTLIISNHQYNLVHIYVALLAMGITYFFLAEAQVITTSKVLSKLYDPIRIALVFSFLSGLFMLGKRGVLPISANYSWGAAVVVIIAIMYTLSKLFALLQVSKTRDQLAIYMVSGLLLLPTVWCPAIAGAILIILLSFLVNYKTALVVGIVAFIYFVTQYYYDLHFTLLTKSILLFSSGLLFIVLYLFTHQKLKSNEKV